MRGSILNRTDQLVRELLRADEGDASIRLPREQLVRDSLHEVGLADAGIAVDEERVVNPGRRLRHGVRRGRGEAVGLSNYEGSESVSVPYKGRVGAANLTR